MPRRDLDALLHDVRLAGERILEATRGITFEQYVSEWMRRAAVERQFGIIGEAINEILKQDGTLADRIKSANRIIAFRNHLIHGYAMIDDSTVWDIIENHLPQLLRDVDSLCDPD
jgi:uncharacterized protein with HEPN domain